VADVADRAAAGRDALEVATMGAAQRQAEGDLVAGGDDIVDVCVQVGEGALHHLEALLPGLAAAKRLG
jgi:hypothetical protein